MLVMSCGLSAGATTAAGRAAFTVNNPSDGGTTCVADVSGNIDSPAATNSPNATPQRTRRGAIPETPVHRV